MREILFRGKRLDNGEWLEGSLWNYLGVPRILPPANIVGYDISPDTVGQYTGLTDKNGVKIFEGDVVKYIYGEHFSDDEKPEDAEAQYKRQDVVRYTNGEFFPVPMREDAGDEWYSYGLFDFEVIGNIHDNPKLLEGRK